MSSFPNFSNIAGYVQTELNSRKRNIEKISGLNAWVRVSSGVGDGLIILSNPNFKLFGAAGEGSIYGGGKSSGTLGKTWGGGFVSATANDSVFRPKPNISSIEVDEGSGTLSRKATFTITAYTKGQLDSLCEYFLEPGYSIFIEWGWNIKSSLNKYKNTLDVDSVANYQTFDNVNAAREACGGMYDNYLGFITGGSISLNGNSYEITVKCTGFTELPAYFMGADNSEEKGTESEKKTAAEYSTSQISAETDLGKKRFMMAFNRLPSNRRTERVSALRTEADVANAVNFINIDETVKAKVNKCTTGTQILGFTLNNEEATFESGGKKTDVEFPAGSEIIKDDAFIKFSALIRIINQIGIEGFMIGGKEVKTQIRTDNTACTAFPKIFSTDKTKLFIPNKTAPKFDIVKAANSETDNGVSNEEVDDCSVSGTDGTIVQFPAAGAIVDGSANGVVIQNKVDSSFIGLNKPEGQWGFLNDLYVNLDFAKGILETKNFSIKDGLYQILNGMAGAAGGIWDFQIIPGENNDELRVVDLNLTATGKEKPFEFELHGVSSIFIDASLDLDISGAKMNQIIGNRIGQNINGSQKDITSKKKGLFTDKEDKILTTIRRREEPPPSDDSPPEGPTADEIEEAKQKNLQLFLDKVGFMPRPDKDDKFDFAANLSAACFIVAYNDQAVFEFFKKQNDVTDVQTESDGTGPIMPIKFNFSIHGVSGIKRGDKFMVTGLPAGYQNGFFQVTSVKHTISEMMWKTEIEGSYRQAR